MSGIRELFTRLFGGAPAPPREAVQAPTPPGVFITAEQLPEYLPVLPMRNALLFPGGVLPIAVGRPASIAMLNQAVDGDGLVIMVAQRHAEDVTPRPIDLFDAGTIARVVKVLPNQPDGSLAAVLQGLERARLVHYTRESPHLVARFQLIPSVNSDALGVPEATGALRALGMRCAEFLVDHQEDAKKLLTEVQVPGHLVDLAIANFDLPLFQKQRVLELSDVPARLALGIELLERKLQAFAEQENDAQRRD